MLVGRNKPPGPAFGGPMINSAHCAPSLRETSPAFRRERRNARSWLMRLRSFNALTRRRPNPNIIHSEATPGRKRRPQQASTTVPVLVRSKNETGHGD